MKTDGKTCGEMRQKQRRTLPTGELIKKTRAGRRAITVVRSQVLGWCEPGSAPTWGKCWSEP